MSISYKDSGVDVERGYEAVRLMKEHVKSTYTSGVLGDLGSFGGFFAMPKDIKHPVLVAGTDGVGTKLKYAIISGKHDTIGIDAVAMCVNDIVCQARKEPLRVILNGLGKDAAYIISRINGFTYVETDYDFSTGELKVVREKAFSDGEKAAVRVYGANDVLEGVAIMKAEKVDVSITGNSTNPTRFQHLVAGTYKKWCWENGVKYFSVASGGGTDFQSVIDANEKEKFCEIAYLIASKEGIGAIDRAQKHGIATAVFSKRDYPDTDALYAELTYLLNFNRIDYIVLAGWLKIIPDSFIKTFEDRIINIHPSLIPAFCGAGFYGLKVHKAVIDYGAKVSGCTVHFVNEVPDGGAIIAQTAVKVEDDDTPESLQARILQEEHKLLPYCVKKLCEGKIIKNGRTVTIV